jgi:hypothetical protein
LRKLVLTTLSLAAMGGGVIGTAVAEPREPKKQKDKLGYGEKISRKANLTIRAAQNCQRKLDRNVIEVKHLYRFHSVKRRIYVFLKWKARNENCWEDWRERPHVGFGLPPHYSAWLCIHKYEGSWTDSGDPYWGGLQMDRTFMTSYAPNYLLSKGWANTWTPLEQMWVAERAYASGRGFHPWPNTARMCGLI